MIEELFQRIISENTEEDVLANVEELKSEYVSDWEDEFESLEEAYAEQGRGEAESQALRELIRDKLSLDDYCELQGKLAEHCGLNLS
jgi:hypothetical protein